MCAAACCLCLLLARLLFAFAVRQQSHSRPLHLELQNLLSFLSCLCDRLLARLPPPSLRLEWLSHTHHACQLRPKTHMTGPLPCTCCCCRLLARRLPPNFRLGAAASQRSCLAGLMAASLLVAGWEARLPQHRCRCRLGKTGMMHCCLHQAAAPRYCGCHSNDQASAALLVLLAATRVPRTGFMVCGKAAKLVVCLSCLPCKSLHCLSS
jgi:hypothetical protein